MNFGKALEAMKNGQSVMREQFGSEIRVKAQYPDKDSKMTIPYMYMEKMVGGHVRRFPVTLSCESIFADDWKITFGSGIK